MEGRVVLRAVMGVVGVVWIAATAGGAPIPQTYTVTNTNDSGAGSLRWAIGEANSHSGPDTIRFHLSLSGSTIAPLTQLPALSSGGTVIRGDIDGNGTPDIILSGKNVPGGDNGLIVTHKAAGSGCTIQGLVIVRFNAGIHIAGSPDNVIQGCHVGVNRVGKLAVRNFSHDIYCDSAARTTIGGDLPGQRNILAGGHPSTPIGGGVCLNSCTYTLVRGNYFGLTRDGSAALGSGQTGVHIYQGYLNTIGGAGTTSPNVFGGLETGVHLHGAADNGISGNYFGLAADGHTSLALKKGIVLESASHENLIGGTSAAARNVFAGGVSSTGVALADVGTGNNHVKGNYFGLNAAGTTQRPLGFGVLLTAGAGAHTIGGATAKAANYFACAPSALETKSIALEEGGDGTLIRNNRFGLRPDGQPAPEAYWAVDIQDTHSVVVTENTIAQAHIGVGIGFMGQARLTRNVFRNCDIGVHPSANAVVNLGNLGNASTADDGGNIFKPTNTWHILNNCYEPVKAEGNDWSTTVASKIDAKIYDHLDNHAYTRVDYDPLIGGVSPTGETSPIVVSGATAVPTAGGAEIVFGLSAPAEVTVTVLNIAGRPVATVVQDRTTEAGLQRIVWSGQSATGTHVPEGWYLVHIAARGEGGPQACGSAILSLTH